MLETIKYDSYINIQPITLSNGIIDEGFKEKFIDLCNSYKVLS
jgi:hypothetical protein